jgi:hypothetical protein
LINLIEVKRTPLSGFGWLECAQRGMNVVLVDVYRTRWTLLKRECWCNSGLRSLTSSAGAWPHGTAVFCLKFCLQCSTTPRVLVA